MQNTNRKNRLLPAIGNLLQMFAGGGDETAPARLPPLVNPTNPVNVVPQAVTPEVLPPLTTQNAPVEQPPNQLPPISPDIAGMNGAMIPNAAPTLTAPIAERILPPIVPPSQATQAEINAVNSKDYGKAQYDESGALIKERGKDRDKKWSLGEKILGGVLGFLENGAVGAISNATDRNFMEKRNDAQRLNRLLPQLGQQQKSEDFQTDQTYRQAQIDSVKEKPVLKREEIKARIESDIAKQKGRMDVINRQADIRSGEAKIFVDEDGKQWKQFLKAGADGQTRPMEPIVNPTTGEQEFAPGEQMVSWQDPLTGNTIQVKAKQVLMPGATLATGNAARAQQADTTNVNNQMEVEQKNVANQLTYQNQTNNVLSTILANDAQLAQYGGNVAGLRASMDAQSIEAQQLLQQIQLAEAEGMGGTDAQIKAANAKREKLQSRYNELADGFNKSNVQLYEELGKTEAGRQKADQLKKLMPKAPPKLTFRPIRAAKVSGGLGGKYSGQSFRLNDVRGAFGNKTDAEIKQIIESNGGRLTN